VGFGGMCEVLGCPPSEIRKRHPDMTMEDYYFLTAYSVSKIRITGEMYGLIKPEGMQVKSPPKFRVLPKQVR